MPGSRFKNFSESNNNKYIFISENKILWPKIDKNILVEDTINFIVQINGKTRGIIKLKTGDNEKEILEKM